MKYRLTYEEFQQHFARQGTGRRGSSGADADFEQVAAKELVKRYRKCFGDPIPPDAWLPRRDSCEPMEFNEAQHWVRWFEKRVRWRKLSSLRKKGPEGSLDDPIAGPVYQRSVHSEDPAEVALSNLMVDRVVEAIRSDFNVRRRFGPDVRVCLIDTMLEVAAGAPGEVEALLRKNLTDRLPAIFDGGVNGRKALSRATGYGMDEFRRLCRPLLED